MYCTSFSYSSKSSSNVYALSSSRSSGESFSRPFWNL
ncbi:Uncharacterised protein [Mycobacteroides abscessus]|nr:Uncharacterised protein [Mycobacteroides abscessus]